MCCLHPAADTGGNCWRPFPLLVRQEGLFINLMNTVFHTICTICTAKFKINFKNLRILFCLFWFFRMFTSRFMKRQNAALPARKRLSQRGSVPHYVTELGQPAFSSQPASHIASLRASNQNICLSKQSQLSNLADRCWCVVIFFITFPSSSPRSVGENNFPLFLPCWN